MKILEVGAKCFKKHVQVVRYEFSKGANAIYGPNKIGKTTIAEIITMTLWGCDISGNNRNLEDLYPTELVDRMLKVPVGLEEKFEEFSEFTQDNFLSRLIKFRKHCRLEKQEIPALVTWVKMEDSNGVPYHISRTRLYTGNTTITINFNPAIQRDVAAIMPSKDLFMAVFVPMYFSNMKDDKKLELLKSLLPDVSSYDMLVEGGMSQENALNLAKEPIHVLINKVKEILTRARKSKSEVQGRLNFILEELSKPDFNSTDSELISIKTAMDKCTNDYNVFKSIHDLYIETYNENRIRMEVNKERSDRIADIKRRNQSNRMRIEEINKGLSGIASIVLPIDRSSELMSKVNAIELPPAVLPDKPNPLKYKLQPLPDAASFPICPECGADLQAYADGHISKVQATNEKIKEVTDAKWKKIFDKWTEEVTKLTKEHGRVNVDILHEKQELFKQASLERTKYNEALALYTQAVTERSRTIQERDNIILEPEIYEERELVAYPEGYEDKTMEWMTSQLSRLKGTLDSLRDSFQSMSEVKGATEQKAILKARYKEECEKLPDQIKEFEDQLEQNIILRNMLVTLPSKMVERQLSSIKKAHPKVDITFFKEVKETGEFIPSLGLKYEGVGYSVLSNSARICLDIELSVIFNKLASTDLPIFVDNTESVLNLPKCLSTGQYFAAYVYKCEGLYLSRT